MTMKFSSLAPFFCAMAKKIATTPLSFLCHDNENIFGIEAPWCDDREHCFDGEPFWCGIEEKSIAIDEIFIVSGTSGLGCRSECAAAAAHRSLDRVGAGGTVAHGAAKFFTGHVLEELLVTADERAVVEGHVEP